MPSRGGVVAPNLELITAVQESARKNGILVIADEVLNLRQSFQGASARYGLVPDVMTMGKIIGEGLPIGAIGGREDVMKVFDASTGRPLLPQGGTFSANPLSMTAGLAVMRHLDHAAFAHLEILGDIVEPGRSALCHRCRLTLPHSSEDRKSERPSRDLSHACRSDSNEGAPTLLCGERHHPAVWCCPIDFVTDDACRR